MLLARLFRVTTSNYALVDHGVINFQTKKVWTDLVALGGAATQQVASDTTMIGQPVAPFQKWPQRRPCR